MPPTFHVPPSAPEVLTGSYTSKIDIFSFGVLLVQMCTGQVPSIERRQDHVASAAASFPDLAPLIRRCLDPDARKRPTADELVGLLERFKISAAYMEYRADHTGGILVERIFRCGCVCLLVVWAAATCGHLTWDACACVMQGASGGCEKRGCGEGQGTGAGGG